MIWEIPKIWNNGDVWILGGGPSVLKQFNIPDALVNKVIGGASPSLYSPYMEALHNKHVIGINVAYLIGEWIDMVFFGDNSFFLAHKKALSEFPGLKVSCSSMVQGYDWVKYLPHHNRKLGISPSNNYVSWNFNSGAAAISIAAHAGAKRIILLGFDMKVEPNKQHWHDLYNRSKSNSTYQAIYDRHLSGFPTIAKDAAKMGIEIINASPESAIQCFPKVSLKDIL